MQRGDIYGNKSHFIWVKNRKTFILKTYLILSLYIQNGLQVIRIDCLIRLNRVLIIFPATTSEEFP